MKDQKVNIQNDLDAILANGVMESEIDHERGIMLYRKLRLMVKEYPELAEKRATLGALIKAYEANRWNEEQITDALIEESDAAEAIIEKEMIFIARRKELIKGRLKKLSLTQKDFGRILGHSSATYISELVNGVCSFSLRDLALIHAMLKIDFEDLIPTAAISSEKDKVVATIHEVKPGLKVDKETLELVESD